MKYNGIAVGEQPTAGPGRIRENQGAETMCPELVDAVAAEEVKSPSPNDKKPEATLLTARKGKTKPGLPRKPRTRATPEGGDGRKPKSGLRMMQVRALKALRDLKADRMSNPASLAEISKKTKVSAGILRLGIGPRDVESRKAVEKKQGFGCLLTLGHVQFAAGNDDVSLAFFITGPGKSALAKYEREHGEKLPPPAAAPYTVNKRPAKAKPAAKKVKAK